MNKIIVAEKEVNDYLTKSKIGQYAINPYVGCPHACKYCYASFMKRFTGHSEPWGDFIDIKHAKRKINAAPIMNCTPQGLNLNAHSPATSFAPVTKMTDTINQLE